MKRTILGMVVGAIVVAAGNWGYDFWRYVSLQSEPSSNWLRIDEFVVEDGAQPMVKVKYQVLRTVAVRTNISPRNVETGAPYCTGRTVTVIYEPGPEVEAMFPVEALTGLENCDWPVGRYVASVTFTMTDAVTNIALNSVAIETNEFRVAPAE